MDNEQRKEGMSHPCVICTMTEFERLDDCSDCPDRPDDSAEDATFTSLEDESPIGDDGIPF